MHSVCIRLHVMPKRRQLALSDQVLVPTKHFSANYGHFLNEKFFVKKGKQSLI